MTRCKSILRLLSGAKIQWSPPKGCAVCGRRMPLLQLNVISKELAEQWEINSEWDKYFTEREGLVCTGCGSARRSVFLAEGILGFARQSLGLESRTFAELVVEADFQKLNVAELNSLGALHRFLVRSPGVVYSEYGSTNPNIRSEDLFNLSYENESFDLIFHSETLEHVPDFRRAWMEIHRVLKPRGVCIFTIPVVADGRKTRTRAHVDNGTLVHDLPASYHGVPGEKKTDYLVFHEFGEDCVEGIQSLGFRINIVRDKNNPSLICFFASKSPV